MASLFSQTNKSAIFLLLSHSITISHRTEGTFFEKKRMSCDTGNINYATSAHTSFCIEFVQYLA